jgi:hypothetical protein
LIGGSIGQFADERAHSSNPKLDIHVILSNIYALDEVSNDAGLFGWE